MNEYIIDSDGESISFTEQKIWTSGTSEEVLQEINGYMIIGSVVTTYCIYIVLEEINQGKDPGDELYKIVRIKADDDDLIINSVIVTRDQALAFKQSGEWFE